MNSKYFSPAGWVWYTRPLFALIMVIFSLWVAGQGDSTTWSWVLGGMGFVLLVLNGVLIVAHRQQGGQFPWQKAPKQ